MSKTKIYSERLTLDKLDAVASMLNTYFLNKKVEVVNGKGNPPEIVELNLIQVRRESSYPCIGLRSLEEGQCWFNASWSLNLHTPNDLELFELDDGKFQLKAVYGDMPKLFKFELPKPIETFGYGNLAKTITTL